MKVYRRPPGPRHGFEIQIVHEWDIQTFGQWQDFLKACGAPVVSIGEYHVEETLDHFLAVSEGTIVGTLQVGKDTQGRHHLHRLIVTPKWRDLGVATELVRWADFFYDNVKLFAYAADDNNLTSLLDMFLFEEVTDAPEPETFSLEDDLEHVQEGSERPDSALGGSGGAQQPLDGADAQEADQRATGEANYRSSSGGSSRRSQDNKGGNRRRRKRGKRGGKNR